MIKPEDLKLLAEHMEYEFLNITEGGNVFVKKDNDVFAYNPEVNPGQAGELLEKFKFRLWPTGYRWRASHRRLSKQYPYADNWKEAVTLAAIEAVKK